MKTPPAHNPPGCGNVVLTASSTLPECECQISLVAMVSCSKPVM